jgi:hypothetical protein
MSVLSDPDDAYRLIEIGRVVESETGDVELLDDLAQC